MIEKDNIRDLFSKTLENHTSPVRPEVWNGLQAKMAVAGVSSVAGAKGMAALTKWLIGTAAVSVATVTTVVLINRNDVPEIPEKRQQETGMVQTGPVAVVEKTPAAEEAQGVDWSKVDDVHTTIGTNVMPPLNYPPVVLPDFGQHSVILNKGVIPLFDSEDGTSVVPHNQEANPANPQVVDEPKKRIEGTENPIIPDVMSPVVEENPAKISKIPNFFSPNNDGENDFLFIESQNIKEFTVVISDARGVIWTSNDPAFKWDGTAMNGDPVPAGTYSLTIMARDMKGKLLREFSTVDIRR